MRAAPLVPARHDPASTSCTAPVVQPALSDRRKAMCRAMSSGRPTRPIGWKASNALVSVASISSGAMRARPGSRRRGCRRQAPRPADEATGPQIPIFARPLRAGRRLRRAGGLDDGQSDVRPVARRPGRARGPGAADLSSPVPRRHGPHARSLRRRVARWSSPRPPEAGQSPKRVAVATGFGSLDRLGRAFRRRYALSPSAFRVLHQA